jgi:hypothetical protein
MTLQRLLIALTLANSTVLIVTLAQGRPAEAQDIPAVLRGRSLEIVDDQGRVRASLQVLPASQQADGQRSAETVLLRLITEKGRPSVKIGSSEETAGLSFAGPTGTKDTYVILESKGTASSLTLKNEGGREQVVKP